MLTLSFQWKLTERYIRWASAVVACDWVTDGDDAVVSIERHVSSRQQKSERELLFCRFNMSFATWQRRGHLSWWLTAAGGYFRTVTKPRNPDRILRTRRPSISPQSASPALSRAVTARRLGPLKGNLKTITPGYQRRLPDFGFGLVQVIQDRLVVSGKPIRDNLVQEWDHQPS